MANLPARRRQLPALSDYPPNWQRVILTVKEPWGEGWEPGDIVKYAEPVGGSFGRGGRRTTLTISRKVDRLPFVVVALYRKTNRKGWPDRERSAILKSVEPIPLVPGD